MGTGDGTERGKSLGTLIVSSDKEAWSEEIRFSIQLKVHPNMSSSRIYLRALQAMGRSKNRYSRAIVQRLGVNKPRNLDFLVDFDGMTYAGNLSQRIDRHIFFFGCYACTELKLLDKAAAALKSSREKLCFVDIGANVGQHTIFMSKRADSILSFEPQKEAVAQLKNNLTINNITNVAVYECALGDQDHSAQLGSGFEGNNGSRSILWTLNPENNTEIAVCHAGNKLDQIGIERVDIIKMDVEGYEKNVLVGLRERLEFDRPVIMFELVGKCKKGGFDTFDDIKNHLYKDHLLFGVDEVSPNNLSRFDWNKHEEAVCIPQELFECFKSYKFFD